jgi:Fe-S oxidoreductase
MGIFSKKKTLYYPGSTLTKYFPELVMNWKTILSDFAIIYETVEDINSGWALWDQGYYDQHIQHQQQLRTYLQKNNVERIITSSPEAAYMLKRFHPEIRVQHTTEVVYQNINKIQEFNDGIATWHDNTTQVRRNNIINQPRAILQHAGFVLKEFDENKKQTQCLGTSTGLVNNSPRLAAKLAMRRAKLAPTKILITDSPEDYIQLKTHSTLDIRELSEVLVEI